MFYSQVLKKYLIVIFIINIHSFFAQNVRVIDNKGTKILIRNNQVTTSNTEPSPAVEADVWFDNIDVNNVITKIYNGTIWVLVNTKVDVLQDADGDTTIHVEQTADEDIIRFFTGNTNPNRQVLRIGNPGLFSGNGTKSAVFGLEANGSNNFDGRFRITSGNDDTFNDTQGASIDLHGNSTTSNQGRVDLMAGSAASGSNLAFTLWGNDGASTPTSKERFVMTGLGNVGIGNNIPNASAILDLTNAQSFALLLPTESISTDITNSTDGMLMYASSKNNAYLKGNGAWKPLAYNTVTNELIFDGDDDADNTNDNYRYVSLIINGNWKVIRYDKTDVNIEDTATVDTNASQTTQPLTLADCTALTF
jgi:hypothetical protein